jgi:signal transduction histidine kinase
MGLQRLKMELADLPAEHEKLLDVIQDSLSRANGIIEDLVRYARVPNPDLSLHPVFDLVEKSLMPYKKHMEQMGIRLEISKQGEGITFADPALLSHVFDNLIRNAMEAQNNGGFLRVSLEDMGEEVAVNFENTGDIPREKDRKNLLEPYFTTKTRGIGLGLAISNRIVKAHSGKMFITFPRQDLIKISVIFLGRES